MWTGDTMEWWDSTRMDRWKTVSASSNPGGDDFQLSFNSEKFL